MCKNKERAYLGGSIGCKCGIFYHQVRSPLQKDGTTALTLVACGVAFELGAGDGDCDSTVVAIGINGATLQGECPTASHAA